MWNTIIITWKKGQINLGRYGVKILSHKFSKFKNISNVLYWTTQADTYLQHFVKFFDQTNINPKQNLFLELGEFLGTCWSKKYFGKFSSNHALLSSINRRCLRPIWFFLLCKFTFFSPTFVFSIIKMKSFAQFFSISVLMFLRKFSWCADPDLYFFRNIFLLISCLFWFLILFWFLVQEHEWSAFAWSLIPILPFLFIIIFLTGRTSISL